MRPTACCTTPPPVHGALTIVSPPPPPPPPPVSTVNASEGEVVVLEGLALSFATTYQLQAPLVNPERFTLHTLPAPCVAAKVCAWPEPWRTAMLTDLMPLASLTVAEKLTAAPTVAPAAGLMPEMDGGIVSFTPAASCAGTLWPCGV